jgi:hypothetical protein
MCCCRLLQRALMALERHHASELRKPAGHALSLLDAALTKSPYMRRCRLSQSALLALERHHASELRKALSEVRDHCCFLEEENEELSMLAFLNERQIAELQAAAGGGAAGGGGAERDRERGDREQRVRSRSRSRYASVVCWLMPAV